MNRGKLILLNGGSSAGKTSAACELQDMMDDMFVHLGIDRFWLAMPPKQLLLDQVEPRYYTAETYFEGNKPYFHITPGPELDKTMYACYRAIASYLEYGVNVVSDQLFWKPEWFLDLLTVMKPYYVFYVGMTVSDEEGARREKMRGAGGASDTESGGRPEGWNRCSAQITHKGMVYDYEIDNTNLSPYETAECIKKSYEECKKPTAFDQLRQKLNAD